MSESINQRPVAGEPAEFETHAVYTLETVETITHIPRERIILYYRHGLVASVTPEDETPPAFDDQAIHRLRRIAFLLSEYEINHEGLRVVSALLNEVEKLREEVRFLRQQ